MSKILNVNLSDQIKEDYMSYSMSVILGRAIPQLTDGMKPISRRIMAAMKMLNLKPDGRFMKSARLDGEVIGKYSPHGSAYGAIVTLAAPWNNNYPLITGQGNFGDSTSQAAHARYTEVKSSPLVWDAILDDSDTWETMPNYDGSLQEPIELNVKFPYVLLNGQEGIGVGYACKIPSHGLRSIVEATKLVCKDAATSKAQAENLRRAREALLPDFPTGTQIVKDEQLEQYSKTGSGSIRCVAKVEISVQKRSGKAKDRSCLTFTSLPPGTNPEKVGEQVKNELERGRIEGVAEVNDLSDLSGDCIQIVAKPGVNPEKLKEELYAFTDLDTKFSAKTLVIDGMKPVELSPVQIVRRWVDWRLDRLQAKFIRELGIKGDRLHIVQGLVRAVDKMDAIIKKIRAAKDKAEAKVALMAAPLKFTDRQAEAILEMRLRQLTNLDQSELLSEEASLKERISELEGLSAEGEGGVAARKAHMVAELTEIGKRHGEARRSPLIDCPTSSIITASHQKGVKAVTVQKPRFLKIDQKKGTVEQSKGPRGAMVVEVKDKIIFMTEDGTLKKVGSNFKGAISSGYSAVILGKRESEVSARTYLTVFELEGQVRAMVMKGEELCKSTSKGKKWLPEGAKLIYFGESPATIGWASKRKKPLTLDLSTKVGKPGAKGVKIAEIKDVLSVG